MQRKFVFHLLAACMALAACISPSLAQTNPGPAPTAPAQSTPALTSAGELRVVTRVLPPMVVNRGGELGGFSIELWNEIASRLNLKFKYEIAPDVRAQLQAVRSGNADVGVAAISITSARETEFDFSQPIMSAGLQIIVGGKGKDGDRNPLMELLGLLFSWTSLAWAGIAVLLIVIPAHVVWLLERRHPGGIIPSDKYIPGIFYALYWAAGTLATQSESSPKHWAARILTILWMFTGLVFVALYTAQLAATLTVQQISGGINGPDDLSGKRVATTRGSTAATVVRTYNAQVVEVGQIAEAYEALNNKTVDAVVFDSPVLLYYAANEGKGRVSIVGAPFRREDYGIVFPQNSNLRTRVNIELLKMREDGTYQRLYDRWFSSK